MSSLTTTVMRFKRTGVGFEEIRNRVSLLVYDFPGRRPGIDEDTNGDFLLYMLPRIPRIIERYQQLEVPFEHYLNACLRWKLKSFLRERTRERRRFEIEMDAHTWIDIREETSAGIPLAEPAVTFGEEDVSPFAEALEQLWPQPAATGYRESYAAAKPYSLRERVVQTATLEHNICRFNARNAGLLYFCLKAVCDIDELHLPRIARMCNVDEQWLAHCRHLLTLRCRGRRERLAELRARQETLYQRLRNGEELLFLEIHPDKRRCIRDQVAKLKRSYQKCAHEIDHVNLRPSNSDIAALLNVPKGSVDSGITKTRMVLGRFLASAGG